MTHYPGFLTIKKTIHGHVIALDGTKVIKENVINGLHKRFSGTAIIVGMGKWKMMGHFMNWKRIVVIIIFIPLGFGTGALVRTMLQCIRRRSLVPSNETTF